MQDSLPVPAVETIIRSALAEDIGPGDLTTSAILDGTERGEARALAKSDLIVAGIDVFAASFRLLDPGASLRESVPDGTAVGRGDTVAVVAGSLSAILMAERTALNFLQRMSGIATMTRRFVEAVAGTGTRILDTRKTVPGLRILDKYAVRTGGGTNHRFALYDGVLVKENHIAAAGGIAAAVSRVRRKTPRTARLEVEVRNLEELDEALRAGADMVMLDNMDTEAMREAVRRVAGRVPLEASGNVTLENVRAIARTGVDFISVGSLTHSVRAADISLLVSPAAPPSA
jgi:nicotinate-nucleotide pyrophosphorylase (carboxylating)